jgi:hypothetical protein
MLISIGPFYTFFAKTKLLKTSVWNTVACTPSEKDNLFPGLTPLTPSPDPPAILDPSIYQTNLLD